MTWLVVLVGFGFILYNLFLNSGGTAKFKSDLPSEGPKFKYKKGVVVCFSILSVISLGLLIVALISFLS